MTIFIDSSWLKRIKLLRSHSPSLTKVSVVDYSICNSNLLARRMECELRSRGSESRLGFRFAIVEEANCSHQEWREKRRLPGSSGESLGPHGAGDHLPLRQQESSLRFGEHIHESHAEVRRFLSPKRKTKADTKKPSFSNSNFWQALMCNVVAFIYWIIICLTMRYTLKLLLMYKGWMYESRGSGSKTSLQTKAWAVLVASK